MDKLITLTADDDIVSIRTYIEWAEARQILLLVPRKNQALRSLVNMKLLARTADQFNLEVALIASDAQIREIAKAAQLKVYANEWFARWSGVLHDKTDRITVSQVDAPVLQMPNVASPSRIRIKNRRLVLVIGQGRVNVWQQLGALVLVGVLGLALVMIVLAIAPQATITLTPNVDWVSTQLTVQADPDPGVTSIDTANNIIPARPVQIELTLFDEIPTVATDVAPVDLATGRVVFVNRTQDQQRIPINTILRTSSGVPIEFLTTQTATLPAGTGSTTVTQIIAVEPGPVGNVNASQINRFGNPTLGLLARVINEVPTRGGSVQQAGIVTEDDKARLRSQLRQTIQQQGYERILSELDSQEFVPPESLQVIELDDISYDKFSGDIAETLGGEMRAVVRATAVGSFHANQLTYLSLLNQVPQGRSLLSTGLEFSAGGVEAIEGRAVTFPVNGKGLVVSEINIDLVREAITFMPIGEAQAWLNENLPIATVPGVEIWPNWLGRLPLFGARMTVIINDVEPLIFGVEAE